MAAAVQRWLNFEGCKNPQFADSRGLGRIGVTGMILGLVMGIHIAVALFELQKGLRYSPVLLWSGYMLSLSSFHFLEFFTTACKKPETVSYDSYVVNHSKEYTIAVGASVLEFLLETLLAPTWKYRMRYLSVMGLFCVVMGQLFRVLAMWTAGSNFNHQIMIEKESSHELVTHGVYKYLRHPSYFGWFWWSVGTQMLLANPVCLIGYAYISWLFFAKRIPYEEDTLRRFYPGQYERYCTSTYIGIPFLSYASDKDN